MFFMCLYVIPGLMVLFIVVQSIPLLQGILNPVSIIEVLINKQNKNGRPDLAHYIRPISSQLAVYSRL